MSEQAINSIEKLHDSPAQDLVAYLDFLLKTELATSINASDPFFRSSFSDFPAMDNWRHIKFTEDAHPRLRELLVDAERDARNRAPAAIVLDHIVPNFSRDRSLQTSKTGREAMKLSRSLQESLRVRLFKLVEATSCGIFCGRILESL